MDSLLRLLRGRIARGSIGSIGLQIAEAGLGFLSSIVLARLMGANEFGAYSFAIVAVGFLTIPALLGHNTFAIKEVSALNACKDWSTLRRFFSTTRRRVFLTSCVLSAGVLILVENFGNNLELSMQRAVLFALPIVPILALLRLHEGYLRGLSHVVAAQIPDKALRPLAFLGFVAVAYAFSEQPFRGSDAILLNLSATGVACLAVIALWSHHRPDTLVIEAERPRQVAGWRQALPFALIASVSVLNTQTDVLMLGLMSTAEETGIYRIASRVATLVAFALSAVGAAVAPRLSASHVRGEKREVQQLTMKAVLATVIVAAPIALVLIVAGKQVLSLFGSDFIAGHTSLAILAIGQLINAAMGIVGLLLSMTGYERIVAKTLIATAMLNITLNFVLIPSHGAEGAAVATTVTYLAWNVLLANVVYRKLQFNPTIVGAIAWLRPTRRVE